MLELLLIEPIRVIADDKPPSFINPGGEVGDIYREVLLGVYPILVATLVHGIIYLLVVPRCCVFEQLVGQAIGVLNSYTSMAISALGIVKEFFPWSIV